MDKQAESEWELSKLTPGRYLQAHRSGMALPEDKPKWVVSDVDPISKWRTDLEGVLPGASDMSPEELAEFVQGSPKFPSDIKQRMTDTMADATTRRAMQSRFEGQMLNLLAGGLLAGGGLGVASAVPQWLKARKQLESVPGKKRREEEGELAKSSATDSEAMSTALRTDQPTDVPVGAGKMLDLKPEHSLWMPWGNLPAGAPLGLAAAGGLAGGSVLGHKLMQALSDKLRNKAFAERKKKLRDQFEELLNGGTKYASVEMVIDESYAALEKSAVKPWSHSLVALASMLGLLELTAGVSAGRSMARRTDPLRTKAKAVEHAFKMRRAGKPRPLELKPADEEDEKDQELSASGVLDDASAYDEALDLSKISSLLIKAAYGPSGGVQPMQPMQTPLNIPGKPDATPWGQKIQQGTQNLLNRGLTRAVENPMVQRGISQVAPGVMQNVMGNPAVQSQMQKSLPGMLEGMDFSGLQLSDDQVGQLMGNIDIGKVMGNIPPEQMQAMQQQMMGNVDVGDMLQNVSAEDMQALMGRPDMQSMLREQMGQSLWGGVKDWAGQVGQNFMNPAQGQGYAAMGPGLAGTLGSYLGGSGGNIIQQLMQLLSRITGAVPGIFGGAPDQAVAPSAQALPGVSGGAPEPTGQPATDLPPNMQ